MHFVVSWDILAEGEEWKKINDEMQKGFNDYSWVRSLTTFYIVKVNSYSDWDLIRKNLQSTAKKYTIQVSFIMSPLMKNAKYAGWLAEDLWPKIQRMTT